MSNVSCADWMQRHVAAPGRASRSEVGNCFGVVVVQGGDDVNQLLTVRLLDRARNVVAGVEGYGHGVAAVGEGERFGFAQLRRRNAREIVADVVIQNVRGQHFAVELYYGVCGCLGIRCREIKAVGGGVAQKHGRADVGKAVISKRRFAVIEGRERGLVNRSGCVVAQLAVYQIVGVVVEFLLRHRAVMQHGLRERLQLLGLFGSRFAFLVFDNAVEIILDRVGAACRLFAAGDGGFNAVAHLLGWHIEGHIVNGAALERRGGCNTLSLIGKGNRRIADVVLMRVKVEVDADASLQIEAVSRKGRALKDGFGVGVGAVVEIDCRRVLRAVVKLRCGYSGGTRSGLFAFGAGKVSIGRVGAVPCPAD